MVEAEVIEVTPVSEETAPTTPLEAVDAAPELIAHETATGSEEPQAPAEPAAPAE
jgi:hypothetical protein